MKKLISLFTKIFPRQWLIRMSYLFSWLIRPFYWGNKVECPVCGGHFRKFLPYGYGTATDNRMCPKCLSLEFEAFPRNGISRLTNDVSLKANSPIYVTLSGIVTVFKLLQL